MLGNMQTGVNFGGRAGSCGALDIARETTVAAVKMGLNPSRPDRRLLHFFAQSESINSRVRSTNSRPPLGPTSVLSGIAP